METENYYNFYMTLFHDFDDERDINIYNVVVCLAIIDISFLFFEGFFVGRVLCVFYGLGICIT
jgi:hypothetical protein